MIVLKNIFFVVCVIASIIFSINVLLISIKIFVAIIDPILCRITDYKINILRQPLISTNDYVKYIFVPLGLTALIFLFALINFLLYLGLSNI